MNISLGGMGSHMIKPVTYVNTQLALGMGVRKMRLTFVIVVPKIGMNGRMHIQIGDRASQI